MEKIVVSDLTKRFGEKTVLDHFSLEIEKGGIFCIMGASGCGKTTLLRIMTGLEKADEGTVGGVEPDRISFVFQEDRLIDHLSALSNVILPLKSDAGAKKAGMEALDLLGLKGEEKKHLTVDALLEQFARVSGDEFTNDRALLASKKK